MSNQSRVCHMSCHMPLLHLQQGNGWIMVDRTSMYGVLCTVQYIQSHTCCDAVKPFVS